MLQEVTRCGELESEVHSPRNPIGRPRTNGNRVRRKHVFLRYLDVKNTNPQSEHLEIQLVDREPMGIGLGGNKLFWSISMRGTRIRGLNTSKPIGRPGTNENRVFWKHVFPGGLDVRSGNASLKHLIANGSTGTNGDRPTWKMPLYSRLEKQLKSCTHWWDRTRSRGSRYRHGKD